jgi:opacity protein-like surface antigen
MKFRILVSLILGSTLLLSTASAKVGITNLSSERGIFSLGILGGLSQARSLNIDGSYSGFRGPSYGVETEFRFLKLDQVQLRLFGRYLVADDKGTTRESDTLEIAQTAVGVKTFIKRYFFFSAGYSFNGTKFKNSMVEFSGDNNGPTLGIGFEFNVSENFYLGLSYNFTNFPLRYELPMSSNSYVENSALLLSLTWSPASINVSMEKPR